MESGFLYNVFALLHPSSTLITRTHRWHLSPAANDQTNHHHRLSPSLHRLHLPLAFTDQTKLPSLLIFHIDDFTPPNPPKTLPRQIGTLIWILSNIVKYCQILSNIVKYPPNIVCVTRPFWAIWTHPSRIFGFRCPKTSSF